MLKNQLINILCDVAYEVGSEEGMIEVGRKQLNLAHRVTNRYQKSDESWKLIHHHADISPVMVEMLSRLQTGS